MVMGLLGAGGGPSAPPVLRARHSSKHGTSCFRHAYGPAGRNKQKAIPADTPEANLPRRHFLPRFARSPLGCVHGHEVLKP